MNTVLRLSVLTVLVSVIVYGCAADDAGDTGNGETTALGLAVFQNNEGEDICPITGLVTNVDGKAEHEDYEGTRFYFCRDDCPEKFAADPEKYMPS